MRELTLTFTANTDAHGTGDVVAAPQELTNFSLRPGRGAKIVSFQLLDKGDLTAVATELVFLNADGSIGAESAAYGPADAVAATVVGSLAVPSANAFDLANSKLYIVKDVQLAMCTAPTTTSLWVGLVARGNIQPAAASDLVLTIVVSDES